MRISDWSSDVCSSDLTSFANGGQLSYRYVSPLADAGVPLQAIGWMLRGADAPLRFRPQASLHQLRWCLQFLLACRRSVNRRNADHLLQPALHSQQLLRSWREQEQLDGLARYIGRAHRGPTVTNEHPVCTLRP